MNREIRCQAVILRNNYVLTARQYNSQRQEEYWLLPGSELEEGETLEEYKGGILIEKILLCTYYRHTNNSELVSKWMF